MMRQRETLLWTFVMPILFFYFIGTVTGGFGEPTAAADAPDPLAVRAVGGESDLLVGELVRRLEAQDFSVRWPATEAEFAQYRRRLVVPGPAEGYSTLTESVLAGHQAVLTFYRGGDDPGAAFDQVRVARAVYGVLADVVVLADGNAGVTAAGFRQLAEKPRALRLRVESAGERLEPPDGFAQAVPGTMVMFTMLILLTSGAITLVLERNQGLLRRLASTPISRASVVTGKWVGKMALGLVQIAFAMIAGSVLFAMDWGPSLGMVLLVLFSWAAFNASLGILLGVLARTEAQMTGIGVLATMVLAALGGAWWPIEITPGWMQALALTLPTGWAMDAMHELIAFGHGAASAVPHTTALLIGALILGWIGTRKFRYQ